MTWQTDFTNAPKGTVRLIQITHHKGDTAFTKEVTQKVPVLLSVGKEVIQSHWVEKQGRWSGLATGQEPDAWQAWPEPFVKEEA